MAGLLSAFSLYAVLSSVSTSSDLSCLDDDDNVEEDLCVTGNVALPGKHTFSIIQEMCLNAHPIYESIDLDDRRTVSQNESAAYFLQFLLISTSVGNEVGMWVLFEDALAAQLIAVCARDDILDCTSGAWEVMVVLAH